MPNRRSANESHRYPLLRAELLREFKIRKTKNERFSLRAFARFLQLPVTSLKYLLDGNRRPTEKTLLKIADRLQWSEETAAAIRRELDSRSATAPVFAAPKIISGKDRQHWLSNPLVPAIHALSRLRKFPPDLNQISKSLRADPEETAAALRYLMDRRIVGIDGNILKSLAEPLIEGKAGPEEMAWRAGGSPGIEQVFFVPLPDASGRALIDCAFEMRRQLLKATKDAGESKLVQIAIAFSVIQELEYEGV